ncbi:LINE-1 type transposase domain-containing protein 1 [Holothuria leucospilota]|uniref:LINE-1 type transposase domain-containing protein 1 n=1 Tax=Holothuria leucospilota TaxID=206669 RepID=A0A9Q1H435_HOLLE|nr:LINE-1 type transposase domain-containing protein 1 [Holothuria leucospilota]
MKMANPKTVENVTKWLKIMQKLCAVSTVHPGIIQGGKVFQMKYYKFLNAGGDQIHWFCKSCNSKALDVMKLVQGLKERNEMLEAKLDEVKGQFEEIALVRGSFAEKIREITREAVQEAKEKELRECNVAISNIKETDHGAAGDPDQEPVTDNGIVKQLIHNVLGASDVEVVSTTRVPKVKNQGETYNRKLVVKLGSVNQKHKVLRIAKRLRDNDDWQGVYISPDLTKQERKKDYELRSELKYSKFQSL